MFRETVDLNGKWEFCLDPDDVGCKKKWFNGQQAMPDKIKVRRFKNLVRRAVEGLIFENQPRIVVKI